jgi:hypothetical protein
MSSGVISKIGSNYGTEDIRYHEVRQGDKYLHGPWGGTCTAHYENGCLWLFRSPHAINMDMNMDIDMDADMDTSVTPTSDLGTPSSPPSSYNYRIWKCRSPDDTQNLLSGKCIWVLWDNRDMKRMRMDVQGGDFYVEHGHDNWVAFWSKRIKCKRSDETLPIPTDMKLDCPATMPISMSISTSEESNNAVRMSALPNGNMVGGECTHHTSMNANVKRTNELMMKHPPRSEYEHSFGDMQRNKRLKRIM